MSRAASHKLQHAALSGTSSLNASRLLALADETAASVTALTLGGTREPWIHVSKRSAHRHDYWLGRYREGKNNKTSLRFCVEAKPGTGGTTALSTGLTFFRTRQPMFLGLIPSGPKELIGYANYKRFMVNLEDALRAQDPRADVTLHERPLATGRAVPNPHRQPGVNHAP